MRRLRVGTGEQAGVICPEGVENDGRYRAQPDTRRVRMRRLRKSTVLLTATAVAMFGTAQPAFAATATASATAIAVAGSANPAVASSFAGPFHCLLRPVHSKPWCFRKEDALR